MAGQHGGARPNSGRKKGSTNLITIDALRKAVDGKIKIPFEELLADLTLKFYQDLQRDHNVDAATRFIDNMAKRMIQPVPTVIEVDDSETPTTVAEIDAKLNAIIARSVISKELAENTKTELLNSPSPTNPLEQPKE